MDFIFKIKKDEYPMIFCLNEEQKDTILKKIFSIGYNFLFRNDINSEISSNDLEIRLHSLDENLSKLIGLSNSSMKKGEFAENILENTIKNRFNDIKYDNMAQVDHSGDAWIQFDNMSELVMLESKNYTKKVNKDEVNKMKNDMITNNIKWGIFYSWNSEIQSYKNFDILTFNNNSETFTILLISNLVQNTSMIDTSLIIIKKLINTFSNKKKFPWITNKIKNELVELNKIINLNYELRTSFIDMEKGIKLYLDKYYSILREYQHQIDSNVNNIINEINGTMEKSIELNNDFDYTHFLDSYKKQKKLFIVLSKIIDVFKEKKITIDDDNNLIIEKEIIGNIKIQLKKVIIYITKYNANCEFILDNENKQSFNFINII